MARPLFWLGIPTTTTATVIVRATSDGTVTVTCNGSDFTATAATATDDGLVKITVTGLSPDTKYSYTVTLPNTDSGSAILKTFPSSGEARIAYYSCNNSNSDYGFQSILSKDPHAVICIGDFGYFSGAAEYGSDTAGSLTGGSTTLSNYHDAYRVRHSFPSIRRLLENVPFGHIPDDHEWDSNNLVYGGLSDAILNTGSEGAWDYTRCNPTNSDTTGDTNPFYFSFECGDAEVFVLAQVLQCFDTSDAQKGIRDAIGVGNGNIGRNSTTNQETWLLAQLAASTKTYKIVLSPKMTLASTNTNSDSWSKYGTEMDRVLQAIHDNSSGWSVPGGVIFGCGDWHSPGIHSSESTGGVKTYDHVAVTAAGMWNDVEDPGAAVSGITRYIVNGGITGGTSGYPYYAGLYGLFITDDTRVKVYIYNGNSREIASASVAAGSLSLYSEALTVSI